MNHRTPKCWSDVVEHLRVLCFPRMVSLENFSTPNFQLVSEILLWLMTTVDSDHDHSTAIDSQQDRYKKLGVQLNMVRLYGADKLAARELLKITNCLYEASQAAIHPRIDSEDRPEISGTSPVVSVKLASSIIMDAASLCDSLRKECDDKIKRTAALDQALDLDSMEASVVAALHALASTVTEIKEATECLVRQQEEVVEKMHKKNDSLMRNQKRLEALMKIK
ncbi:Clusterin-associated protein 1-like 2 [Homarus americanus]|uniref:Clusterin-associated protein 1-like 2 n=1 Tax=Homarus americanus TaxID=6706 RepID=A0A8J5JSI7_HOMAM|nr:Clusterin-associated protein 1-like 2 [Homarus americanus]